MRSVSNLPLPQRATVGWVGVFSVKTPLWTMFGVNGFDSISSSRKQSTHVEMARGVANPMAHGGVKGQISVLLDSLPARTLSNLPLPLTRNPRIGGLQFLSVCPLLTRRQQCHL